MIDFENHKEISERFGYPDAIGLDDFDEAFDDGAKAALSRSSSLD